MEFSQITGTENGADNNQLKDRMRQIIWQEVVKDVVKHSHKKPVIRRLEKLLAALNRSV